jgi:hypothetical protein
MNNFSGEFTNKKLVEPVKKVEKKEILITHNILAGKYYFNNIININHV